MPINLAKIQGALRPPCDDQSQDGPQISVSSGGPIEPGQHQGGIGRDVAPARQGHGRAPSQKSSAVAMRKLREREANGQWQTGVPTFSASVLDHLIDRGYLSESDSLDKGKTTLALQAYVEDSVRADVTQQKFM